MNRGLALLLLCVQLAVACTRTADTPADGPHTPVAAAATSATATTGSAATGEDSAAVVEAPTQAATAPGETVFTLPGHFAPDSSLADLRKRYGASNVQVGKVPGAEGESIDGVTLFPDDPAQRAYLYFQDAHQWRGLSMVRVRDAPSRWRFNDGISVGTPLAALVERNGEAIRFHGLGWDYGGIVTEWNGGRLDPIHATDGLHRSISLTTRSGIGDTPYPTGDGEFSSDDRRYPSLGRDLEVGEIGVSFPGEDDL